MIKNLNEFLSFVTLILANILTFGVFISYSFKIEHDINKVSKLQLIKDYINNEEE